MTSAENMVAAGGAVAHRSADGGLLDGGHYAALGTWLRMASDRPRGRPDWRCHISASSTPISFEQDIKPLFRERDRGSMEGAFDLWSHDDAAQHSDAIVGRLRDGSMPCDGAWPQEQVAVFQRWIDAGTPT